MGGLRFSYSPSYDGGHSVGIRFADRKNEQMKEKDKHWIYIQSWSGVEPVLLTDLELARYIVKAEVGHEKHFKKKLYVVTVQDGKSLVPMLPSIENNDEAL